MIFAARTHQGPGRNFNIESRTTNFARNEDGGGSVRRGGGRHSLLNRLWRCLASPTAVQLLAAAALCVAAAACPIGVAASANPQQETNATRLPSRPAAATTKGAAKSARGGGPPATGGAPPQAPAAAATTSYQLHPLSPRLIALGDVHGDIHNFKAILRHAQLIDCDGNWDGGDARVVQLGDVCDRGPHSHSIIEYIDETLVPQARAAGGEFLQLLGNHELLTMRGDARFVAAEQLAAFGGSAEEWAHHFSTRGAYGARNSRLDTIAIRNGTAFVHAGLLPAHAEKGVEWVNAEMRTMMAANNWEHPFASVDSPVWTRAQVYAAMRRGDCASLHESLRRLSASEVARGRMPVSRLVVGHTIQPAGAVSVFCGGQFVAADVASSQYMAGGGHLAFVEFRQRVLVRTAADGSVAFADRFASEFADKGRLAGREAETLAGSPSSERPLSPPELQYLLQLNEGFGSPSARRAQPAPLEIVAVPSYPPIPWKRHANTPVLAPRWAAIRVAAAANGTFASPSPAAKVKAKGATSGVAQPAGGMEKAPAPPLASSAFVLALVALMFVAVAAVRFFGRALLRRRPKRQQHTV